MNGKFITIEGVDGAGKSSHLNFISNYLKDKSINLVITREPGGTVVAEQIRNIILNSVKIEPVTELLLAFAARQEHITDVIVPALNASKWVLSDRFVEASIAYQGAGRGLGEQMVADLYKMLSPAVVSNLTIVFDVPLAVAKKRMDDTRNKDRIEQESDEFFIRVQQAYYKLASANPNRIKIVSTDCSISETEEQLKLILDDFMASTCITI